MSNPATTSSGIRVAATNPMLGACGSWASPISIDDVLTQGVGIRDVLCDGDAVYWLESRPAEDSRVTIMRLHDGERTELTPGINVGSRVQEYGGGAYHVKDDIIVFSDRADGRVKTLENGEIRTLTSGDNDVRFADFRVVPNRGIVLAAREDHRPSGQAETTLVALSLTGDSLGTVMCQGADFYGYPELADDGRLAWVEWNQPDMPWDATVVKVGTLTDDGVTDVTTAYGREQTSALFPRWQGTSLVFFSDESGFWTPWEWDGNGCRQLLDQPFDFCPAPWNLGNHRSATLDDGSLIVAWYDQGFAHLGRLAQGELTPLVDGPLADVNSVAAFDDRVYAIVSYPDRPDELIQVLPEYHPLVTTGDAPDPAYYSAPESLTIQGRHGDFQAWFYAPANARYCPPAGERPPLIVMSHGGPTGMADCGYSAGVQWWTSRGFAVMDVNYSGSAGFGREFRNRLYGEWGNADRDDCVDAVHHVVTDERADGKRVAIMGGSAGGYTTLRCLTTSHAFAAGVSRYGIGDLETLATDTHKFEARYLDYIVGPYPQDRDTYVDRSPIHHLEGLEAPMLILQGTDDRVVPPSQAEAMADAVRAKQLPVALVMFEGEAHGFRGLAARRKALESELSFYSQLFGFTPADNVPTLEIENLD